MTDYTRDAATSADDSTLSFGADTITEVVNGISITSLIIGRDVHGNLATVEVDSFLRSLRNTLASLPAYLDQSEAITGGAVNGDLYWTSAGVLSRVV